VQNIIRPHILTNQLPTCLQSQPQPTLWCNHPLNLRHV
jgi:hypothetical protein